MLGGGGVGDGDGGRPKGCPPDGAAPDVEIYQQSNAFPPLFQSCRTKFKSLAHAICLAYALNRALRRR